MELMTTEKTGNLTTWAADINAAHADAVKHATSAIDYAKRAGELLLKVKQKLPHGAFGAWLEANCVVKARQAQYYMNAAQGKSVPVRKLSNTQPTAYLNAPESAAPSLSTMDSEKTLHDYFRPSWIPMKGYAYCCATDTCAYWVVHSKEHPGFFHVSHLTEDNYSGTRRPVAGIAVEYMLQGYGLTVPADADWNVRKGYDMTRPFGEPEELLAEWTAQRFCTNTPMHH